MSSAFENAMSDLQANNYTQQYPVAPAEAQSAEAMHNAERLAYLDTFDYDSLPSIDTVFSNRTLMQRWPRCRKSCELRRQAIAKRDADFSAANDAALMSMADQYDDMLDWQWSIGDLGL